jgi:glycosyltransferase involved in cell wall biosynthesis
VLKAFDDLHIKGKLIVVNDGSTDKRGQIIDEFMNRDHRISKINHERPAGVGRSYWEGVQKAEGEVVCYTPGDNGNDSKEILRYLNLLENVDFVVPFGFFYQAEVLVKLMNKDIYMQKCPIAYPNGTRVNRRP